MKIGIFTDSYFPQINGVTYTLSLWKRELEKLGHEVYVYYPNDKGHTPGKNEVPLRSIPFIFYKGYDVGLPSRSKVRDDLDIIHIQSPASVGLFGFFVAKKRDIPCIMTYHTPPDKYLKEILPMSNEMVRESLKVAYYRYEEELLKGCNMITAASEIIIDILKERLGKNLSKAAYFSNGIDPGFFKEASGEKFKKDYKVPEGKVLGFAGRHTEGKHVEDLINLADSFDGAIVISGEGPSTKKYKKLAKGKKNVMFIGFMDRDRMCEFYSAIDILVLPSTAETEGLVVLEANACGTPAVGADAMALKTTIRDGLNGYHYKPGDIKDLLDTIDKTYKDMDKLDPKKMAEEKSVEKTAKKLVNIYGELLDER
jgi:glycosyltransferase involved in cell wall biosynthesis